VKSFLCLILCAVLGVFGAPSAEVAGNIAGENPNFWGAEGAERIALPIVMYHKIAKRGAGKYVVTVDQLESDFRAFKEAGFTAVFMSEVIDWVDGRGELPAKPIVITFDDGQYNNLCYGLPVAEKFDMKFMICPVTSFSQFTVDKNDADNPSYSHITWEQMGEAAKSGRVEFGNHTHNMHKFKPRYGIAKLSSEDEEQYCSELRRDFEIAQQLIEKTGAPKPSTFAYPFGKYTKEGRSVLIDMGFRAMLTCNERVSVIERGKPESLHELGRFNRSGNYSTEKILSKIGN
jgi:peptidoglycan/xylan/chitin deacetylase (PgdA/CDA1 family)